MANSLGTETPPAPRSGSSNALLSGATPQPSIVNALASDAGPSSQPGPSGAPVQPAPTHAQTVAVLRHTTAVAKELRSLLSLPELGRSSVKKQIINGTLGLVTSHILTPVQAVSMLSTVPDEPLLQQKWAKSQLASCEAGMNNILDHHAAAFPGTGDLATELQHSQSNADNHFDDVAAAMAHFSRGKA